MNPYSCSLYQLLEKVFEVFQLLVHILVHRADFLCSTGPRVWDFSLTLRCWSRARPWRSPSSSSSVLTPHGFACRATSLWYLPAAHFRAFSQLGFVWVSVLLCSILISRSRLLTLFVPLILLWLKILLLLVDDPVLASLSANLHNSFNRFLVCKLSLATANSI